LPSPALLLSVPLLCHVPAGAHPPLPTALSLARCSCSELPAPPLPYPDRPLPGGSHAPAPGAARSGPRAVWSSTAVPALSAAGAEAPHQPSSGRPRNTLGRRARRPVGSGGACLALLRGADARGRGGRRVRACWRGMVAAIGFRCRALRGGR